jgi:CheY-like chemotaxis protein
MGGKTRILVVDDDQAIRELLELVLAAEGYEVITATDGRAALEAARVLSPSVILLDLRMPVLDGWEFVRGYGRGCLPRAPIIAVTAADEAEGGEVPLGVAAVLPKPFELDAVLRAVAEHTGAASDSGCPACAGGSGLGGTVPLAAVRADLERAEALERTIADLLATLRATLSPEQFASVWELRDAEESLGLAEDVLQQRRLVELLARHLPEQAAAIRAAARHLLEGNPAPDTATGDGESTASETGVLPAWVQERLDRSGSALRAAYAELSHIRIIPHG